MAGSGCGIQTDLKKRDTGPASSPPGSGQRGLGTYSTAHVSTPVSGYLIRWPGGICSPHLESQPGRCQHEDMPSLPPDVQSRGSYTLSRRGPARKGEWGPRPAGSLTSQASGPCR